MKVSINIGASLPTTTSEKKYFYLTNKEYFSYSEYIYIRLDDHDFGFNYNSIKYCETSINPDSSPDSAVDTCSFSPISYYSYHSAGSSTVYYYKIPMIKSNAYSIVYYEGKYSSGNLNVESNYTDSAQYIKIFQVSRNSRLSLPTSTSENNFFYLTNSDYYSQSSNIYICLEDSNFGLSYNNLQYCRTNDNLYYYPDNTINGCSFTSVSYYSYQRSSNSTKYYYKIYTSNAYTFSIIFYQGSNSSGSLYVTSNYNDLVKYVKMTQIYRNLKTSLPTTSSENKYFYLTNNDYFSYSSYIYICLEEKSFNLSYNNIQYCLTNTNPGSSPDSAVNDCYFTKISYYNYRSESNIDKYYYKIPITNSYSYSIIHYEGKNSFGYFYITSGYYDLNKNLKMSKVFRNSKTSLPTSTSENKFFYLTNNEYYSYSSYIYIYLEDNDFRLINGKMKYCLTNTNPDSSPDSAVSGCSFITISYYNYQRESITDKYYYKIPITNSYTYSIIYYEGSNTSGSLDITSDYNDLTQCIKMTQVSRNSRLSLPTSTLENKYFYLTNSEYYSYSNYIYICLEDNNFGFRYYNIKYCNTNTNPGSNPDSAVSGCFFSYLPYYSRKSSSGTYKYYYQISTTNSYTYSIIYYEGSDSSKAPYVTSDYKSLLNDDNSEVLSTLSTGAIIGIIIGSNIFLVIIIIIICYFCPCFRKNKIDFKNSFASSSNQQGESDLQLQMLPNTSENN